MDDPELLRRAQAGDDAAWDVLVGRHGPRVRRFFGHRVPIEDVDDLTQESFTRLERAHGEGVAIADFRAFVLGIAWNVLREFVRQRVRGSIVDVERVSAIDLDPRPSTILVKRAERRLLLEGLRRLSLPHQLVLEMHYWEAMTSREIAMVLAEPENTVRGRITRARETLRAELRALEQGKTAPDETDTGFDDWARGLREGLADDDSDDPSG